MSTAGFPDSTVRENRDRVPAAIRNSGLEFPIDRIPVSLAPADVRKEGDPENFFHTNVNIRPS